MGWAFGFTVAYSPYSIYVMCCIASSYREGSVLYEHAFYSEITEGGIKTLGISARVFKTSNCLLRKVFQPGSLGLDY